jgi:lipopolysaccharide export system permease protein
MRAITRYFFSQAAVATLLVLSSLTGVVWIAVALRQLNLLTSQGQDAWTFLAMTTLALPNFIALIAPVAVLVASVFVLSRLNGDSELIVLTAGGATPWRIAKPFIILATVVAIVVAAANHFVMPWSLRLLRDMIIEVRSNLISQVIQPGRFSTPEPGLTFHVRDRTLDGEIEGLMVHDAREAKQVVTYLAQRAVILEQDNIPYIFMSKGHIMRRKDGDAPEIVTFDTYAVDLSRFERKSTAVELKPRERYLDELLRPDPDDPAFKAQPGQFRAELHERFASVLYPFAFVALALAFVGQAQSTRQSRTEALVIAIVLAIAARLGGLALNNVVAVTPIAVPGLYLLPLGVILFCTQRMYRNTRPTPGPGLRDRITMAIEDLLARVSRGGGKKSQVAVSS